MDDWLRAENLKPLPSVLTMDQYEDRLMDLSDTEEPDLEVSNENIFGSMRESDRLLDSTLQQPAEQFFHNKSGNGVCADLLAELWGFPEPEGRARDILRLKKSRIKSFAKSYQSLRLRNLYQSLRNSYQDSFEREWDSRRHSNISQLGLLSGNILGLEMDTKQLLRSVMLSDNVTYEKYLIEETLEKFNFLTKFVPKVFRGRSVSGCYKHERQLLKDYRRLKLLLKDVCERYRFRICGACPTYDDDRKHTTPASSTKDGIKINYMPEISIDNKPRYGVEADPKGKAIEDPSCHNSKEHYLETDWNSILPHSHDSQIKKLSELILDLKTETGHLKDLIDSENILKKWHTEEIQEKFKILTELVTEVPSSSCNNSQLELLKQLERLNSPIAEVSKQDGYGEDHSTTNDDDRNQLEMQEKQNKELHEPKMAKKKCGISSSQHVINTTEENEAAQCGLSCSPCYMINTLQENEVAQNDQGMSKAAQGEGGLSCSHHVMDITQENEATTQDEGGFSGSRHVISTKINEAVQEMSNRCSTTSVESCSRLIRCFVEENIGELVPFFGVLIALLGGLGRPLDLQSHPKETSPPLSLKQAFSMFWGSIVWSGMFFLISVCTAIRIGSLKRRVFAVSMLVLCLVYCFAAIASSTAESSVLYGSAERSAFWLVCGGGASGFVLVILFVLGCFQLFQLI